MLNFVKIINGSYRNIQINGVYPLVKGFQGIAGSTTHGEVTILDVTGEYKFQDRYVPNYVPKYRRIKVVTGNFTYLDAAGAEVEAASMQISGPQLNTTDTGITANPGDTIIPFKSVYTNNSYEEEFISSESEEGAMSRIANSFAILERLTESASAGTIRGLIVSGPPGIGKSFGVKKMLDYADLPKKLAHSDPEYSHYEIISGSISGVVLYQKLFHNKMKENVFVLDDTNGIFDDPEALNVLMKATDSTPVRRISWEKESKALDAAGVPRSFDYEGSIIFLTNLNFERAISRESKIAKQLEALMSRCPYLNLEINSTRDKILRVRQIVRDGMLDNYNFSEETIDSIIDFVVENKDYFREISLRLVKHIADYVVMAPNDWEELVETTHFKREVRFQKLLDKRKNLVSDVLNTQSKEFIDDSTCQSSYITPIELGSQYE